jgi:hypothetical protein
MRKGLTAAPSPVAWVMVVSTFPLVGLYRSL